MHLRAYTYQQLLMYTLYIGFTTIGGANVIEENNISKFFH